MQRELARRGLTLAAAAVVVGALGASAQPRSGADDVAAARRLFEANLDAIRNRDAEAYLDTYLDSDSLARTGNTGIRFGFAEHAAGARQNTWPDVFIARNLQLVSLRPGVVYGTYRYRVAFAGTERIGISERVFVDTQDGWRIAVTSAFDTPAGTPPPPLVLHGATLVDGRGGAPIPDAVVIVRNARIECAGSREACPIPDDVETLDLDGTWITPGIVDAHVHLAQTGWTDGRPDAVDARDLYPYEEVQARLRARPEDLLRAHLGSGVTSVFDVGGYPWTWDLRDSLRTDVPHVAAAGPLLSTLDHWLNLPGESQFVYVADTDAARDAVRYVAEHGSDAVKVWFIPVASRDFETMERTVLAAGDAARARGVPLIVHATGLREAKVALRAGAHLLVHSVWDVEVDDAFLDLARRAGTVYCPTLTVLGNYERLLTSVREGRVPEIDDPHGCVDSTLVQRIRETARLGAERVSPDELTTTRERLARRTAIMHTNLMRVHAARIPIAMGTDAGNPLTLHGPAVYAEMEAMQAAGLTPLDVLRAATLGGAQAMRRDGQSGTLETGKIADLLVLDADPTRDIRNMRALRQVMRRGELRDASEFRQRP